MELSEWGLSKLEAVKEQDYVLGARCAEVVGQ